MSTKERILALRLLEKQETNGEYTGKLGIHVAVTKKLPDNKIDQRRYDNA